MNFDFPEEEKRHKLLINFIILLLMESVSITEYYQKAK